MKEQDHAELKNVSGVDSIGVDLHVYLRDGGRRLRVRLEARERTTRKVGIDAAPAAAR